MNQIARCNWLPERARWSHLARLGLLAVSRKKNFPESHIINPLLTKFVRSRWLDIGLVLFCEFIDLDFFSVHKHAKKELGQYSAVVTSHLVNNPYLYSVYELKVAQAKSGLFIAIAHFRVHLSLSIKERLGAQPFI